MSQEFHFPLLENGFDFLTSSLEHLTLASTTPPPDRRGALTHAHQQRRHLKYALLHAASSMELLLKERLRQEHWSLVFRDVNKATKEEYESGDFQSVTFQESLDRLTNICELELSSQDVKQLKNFRDRRNRLEHFGTIDTLPAVMSTVSGMVGFLVDFVQSAFTPNSRDEAEDLIAGVHTQLGMCNAFIEHRWKEIRAELKDCDVITCPTCQQDAMIVDDGTVTCRFCTHVGTGEAAAEAYVTQVLGYGSRYSIEKDGGEWPIEECPECGNTTLVTAIRGPNDAEESCCFHCGQQWGAGQLSTCTECGARFQDDDDSVICSDCFRYKVEKDD